MPDDTSFDEASLTLVDLLRQSVSLLLRDLQPQELLHWMREEGLRRFPEALPTIGTDERASAALAFALTRALCAAVPIPANGFQPRPLPTPSRNDPCACGSGRKWKRCCGASSAPPFPLPEEEIVALAAEELDSDQLEALARSRGQSPLTTAVLGRRLLENGDAERALALLEPLFGGSTSRLDERYGDALELLCDAYDEAGLESVGRQLVDRLVDELEPPLLAQALVQRAIYLVRDDDTEEALEQTRAAQRADPDHPTAGSLEVTILLGRDELDQAQQRARYCSARLRRDGVPADDGRLVFLASVVADPEQAAAAMHTDAGSSPAAARLASLVAAASERPLPPYRLTTGEAGGRLEPVSDLAGLEDDWAQVKPEALRDDELDSGDDPFPGGHGLGLGDDPFLRDDDEGDLDDEESSLDDDNPWTDADEWVAFLAARPEAFDSIRILDDVLFAALKLEDGPTVWSDGRLLLPLADRLAAIVREAARVAPSPLSPSSRPAPSSQPSPSSRPSRNAGRLRPLDVEHHYDLPGSLLARAFALLRCRRRDEAIEAIDELLQLDADDSLDCRYVLVDELLRAGRDGDVLAAAEAASRPRLDIFLGRALALYRLERREEAGPDLDVVLREYPLAIDYLTGKKRRAPEGHRGRLRFFLGGSKEEAWTYRETMGDLWEETPGALDWLRAERRNAGRRTATGRSKGGGAKRKGGGRKPSTKRAPKGSARGRSTAAICQLVIALDHIAPRIWRRIQMPYPCTFWELHVAIQDAMGWEDAHLHEFLVGPPGRGSRGAASRGAPRSAPRGANVRIGLPEPGFLRSPDVLSDWEVTLDEYLTPESPELTYVYDFGDTWRHSVRLEHVAPADPDVAYPRCIGGERACPPEDSGGPPGYARLLAALRNPRPDADARNLLDWIGEGFDPERFDPEAVGFSNPGARLRRLLPKP